MTFVSPVNAPVPIAKIVSPSFMVCAGTIARANPSCAISAILRACALVILALVAIRPSVVFSPGRCGGRRPRSQELARVDEAAAISAACARHDLAGRGIDDVAGGVERDEGGDGEPVRQRDRRRADAALHRVTAAAELADRGAGAGADTAFGDGPSVAACAAAYPHEASGLINGLPPTGRSNSTAGGNDRHIGAAKRKADFALFEIPHHAAGRVEPESAAAREHDRVDLFDEIRRIEQIGLARSGAEPRTATPAVAPFSTRTTVHPVGRSVRV